MHDDHKQAQIETKAELFENVKSTTKFNTHTMKHIFFQMFQSEDNFSKTVSKL